MRLHHGDTVRLHGNIFTVVEWNEQRDGAHQDTLESWFMLHDNQEHARYRILATGDIERVQLQLNVAGDAEFCEQYHATATDLTMLDIILHTRANAGEATQAAPE